MPRERVTMRKNQRDTPSGLVMQPEQTSHSRSCGVGKTTVTDTLSRAHAANQSWPLPFSLDD